MAETKTLLVGGRGVEFEHFANRVIQGMLVGAPTSASTQATGAAGASVYRVDIPAGLLACGSNVLEVAVQADLVLGGASAECLDGQSKVYAIIYYRSSGDGVVRQKVVKGTAATTGSQVAPTDAEIEATFAAETKWMRIAEVTFNRTGDTTVTQSQDNTKRNTLVPGSYHYSG